MHERTGDKAKYVIPKPLIYTDPFLGTTFVPFTLMIYNPMIMKWIHMSVHAYTNSEFPHYSISLLHLKHLVILQSFYYFFRMWVFRKNFGYP